jgi:hypothetical protein
MSCHQNAEQNENIKIANISFENVAKFKYFGRTITEQNFIHEEIKSRYIRLMLATIKLKNFSFRLPLKNVKIKIYKTIILPIDLYENKT